MKNKKPINCSKLFKVNRSTIYRELNNNSIYQPRAILCQKCLYRFQCIFSKYKYDNATKDFIHSMECILLKNLCIKLKKFPYICNQCKDKKHCSKLKKFYDPIQANILANKRKKESRRWTKFSNKCIQSISSIIIDGINKGQSIHHIYFANSLISSICSETTIRRMIYLEQLGVKAHQLPRYVAYAHHHKSSLQKINKGNDFRKDGRSYMDFIKQIKLHPSKHIWQHDSVIGKRSDKKAILTITHSKNKFLFGLLILKNNATDTLNKIRYLQNLLGDKYWEVFQINLCDNGIEFDKFDQIEYQEDTGEIKTKVFYTRINRATDKSECERNHEFIRYILPKYQSIDWLTQNDLNLMFSHINSYIRKSLNNKTPYELFTQCFNKELAKKLGIVEIPKNNVCLKPKLLK